jgi:predicted DNA-binding transcriptional regulator AlpA
LNAPTRPESAAPAIESLLSIGDVARALSCSRRWHEQARAAGRFPRPDCRLGRSPRWKRTTLEAWIAEGGSR